MTQKIVIAVFLLMSIFFSLMTIIDIIKHINNKDKDFEIDMEILIVSILWAAFYLLNQLPSF